MGLCSLMKKLHVSNGTAEITKAESNSDSTNDMLFRNFIAIDIVATGTCPVVDRIVEIAAVKMCGRVLLDRFSAVINPQINISQKITWLTGISNEQVIGAPTIQEIMPRLVEFIGDYPLILHDSSHIMPLLESRLRVIGIKLSNQFYDIVALSRKYLKDVPLQGYSYTIPELLKYIGSDNKDRKGAFENTVTIAAIYNKIVEEASEPVSL